MLHRLLSVLLVAAAGCSVAGESAERRDLDREGRPYQFRHGERKLPTLPADAPLLDVLQHAFLSNADLERAYFEWKMAVERVPQAASLDDPRFRFERLFSKEKLSRWDRTTLAISQMVPFPGKLDKAGQVALAEAVAAGRRFEDAKFMLQAELVEAWAELRFVRAAIRIAEENLALLRDVAETTRALVAVGKATQVDVTKADLEVTAADNELRARQSEAPPALARLNALLSRPPAAALNPAEPRDPPALPANDDTILALVAERNLELQAMAAEVRGRENALDLARKAYLPDFEFGLEIVGSMERMLMGVLTLPIQLRRIRAGIDEAGAGVRAAEAALRSTRNRVGAQVVLNLYAARDAARQAALFRDSLIPRAQEIVDATKAAYKTGSMSFLELLDAQRAVLDLRLGRARMESMRDQAIARLEALAALDFGTLEAHR